MIFDLLFRVLFTAILKVNSENDVSEASGDILATREGVVKNESFVYLYVYHQGNINLSLKSTFGDADLYISDTNLLPTYNVDSYDFHSATCGIDVINIPATYGSPLSVGIYGHPAHEKSYFLLEVLKSSSNDINSHITITNEVPETLLLDSNHKGNAESTGQKSVSKIKYKKKNNKISSNLSGFFSLLEVFQLIFL